MNSSAKKLADMYVRKIVARHSMPVSIVFDRDVWFTSWLWKRFHEDLGTRLHFNTSYHPQTDGQSERTIQTLVDMLRVCFIDFDRNWDSYLPLDEFSYKKYHYTIRAPKFHLFMGGSCIPQSVGERSVAGTWE